MSRSEPDRHDLVVVGGGINGAGIARDAAMRGLDVLLLEQGDFGGGTSSWSSRLIHGGLRYLEHVEIPLVYESLHERSTLLEIAPHLVHPLRLVIPIYRGARRGRLLVRLGMLAYDLLSRGKKLPGHEMLSPEELLAAEPGVAGEGLRGAAAYYDAQVTYAERLVMENVIAAREAGAVARNYCTVDRFCRSDDAIAGVEYVDADGNRQTALAPVVVNAAGPWVDRVLAGLDTETRPLVGGTKGSHIVVEAFPGAPQSAFYIEAQADGRPLFVLPWNGCYLIGTTDTRYEGDPGDARVTAGEVDYLLDEVNRVFPQAALGPGSVRFVYAGVRPLPLKKGPTGAITRKHIVERHAEPARGLISIVGGKLTTFRSLAEETVDAVAKSLGRDLPRAGTAAEPLPGGRDYEQARRELGARDFGERSVAHLTEVYGARALAVAELAAGDPELAEPLCPASGALNAELVHAREAEGAVTLADILHRRTMLGLRPGLGQGVAGRAARFLTRRYGWDAQRERELLADYEAYLDRLRPPPTGKGPER